MIISHKNKDEKTISLDQKSNFEDIVPEQIEKSSTTDKTPISHKPHNTNNGKGPDPQKQYPSIHVKQDIAKIINYDETTVYKYDPDNPLVIHVKRK